MFPYADYEFYKEKAHGTAPQDVFNAEVLEASFFLQYLTMGKSDKEQPEALQYAVCKITDMYIQEKTKRNNGIGGIKSESNDGYSVSYSVEQKDGELLEELLARKASDIARKYLINTGLLNRKVGCGHDHQCGYHYL